MVVAVAIILIAATLLGLAHGAALGGFGPVPQADAVVPLRLARARSAGDE